MATKKSAPKKSTASRPAAQQSSGWNFDNIQELIRMINKSELAEVEVEHQDFKLRVSRYPSSSGQPVVYAQAPLAPAPQPMALPPANAPAQAAAAAESPAPKAEAPAAGVPFKSPMIGTFYRTPGPDKDPFVKVGDIVTKGQVLCIVEAMKLFNEIESDVDGKIVKILVENATPVEYDQPLFLIEPTK
jgi:acetyl-CoA carboxylase biotin carboxyl carrier protein